MSRKNKATNHRNLILIAIALGAGAFAVIHLIDRELKTSIPDDPKPWYRQGTLDEATVGQWRKADREDRIATCAGWLVDGGERLNMRVDHQELRMLAEEFDQQLARHIDNKPGGLEGIKIRKEARYWIDRMLNEINRRQGTLQDGRWRARYYWCRWFGDVRSKTVLLRGQFHYVRHHAGSFHSARILRA